MFGAPRELVDWLDLNAVQAVGQFIKYRGLFKIGSSILTFIQSSYLGG
jgi:hypothetical protein